MARVMNTVGATVSLEWLSGGTDAATLAVTRPDGTALTPAPTVSLTSGLQKASIDATQPGQYALTWSIPSGAVHTDVVDVWPTNPRYLVSQADVIKRLSAAGPIRAADLGEWLETLSLYIASATEVVEWITGALLPKQRTHEASGREGRRKVLLPASHITVQSVTVDDALLPEADYKVDKMAGVVISDSFTEGDLNIVVAFTEGTATRIPPNARLACLEIVAHMWQRSRQGNREAASDDTVATPYGFAIPRAAWELLQGLKSPAGTA